MHRRTVLLNIVHTVQVGNRLRSYCSRFAGTSLADPFTLPTQVHRTLYIMSNVDIHAQHTLSHEAAQDAADELAQDLALKFGIDYGWDGDEIHFERPGVHGRIQVMNNEIRVQAYLGFLLAMLKGPIEQEIVRYLKEHFGCTFS